MEKTMFISYLLHKDKDKNKILKIVFIVFLGVIVFGGLVGIGFYYGKITYMQRKKRANELKDGDFDYTSNDNDNKLINSD